MSEQNNTLNMSTTENVNASFTSLDYTIIPSLEAADTLDSRSLTELPMRQASQPHRQGYGITLCLPALHKSFELWNKPLITLGRRDNPHRVFPNLDLSEHHAIQLGVSRLHAQIIFKNRCFYVLDLASKNGTWLNTKQLAPHQPEVLHHRDILRLGHLILYIGACQYS